MAPPYAIIRNTLDLVDRVSPTVWALAVDESWHPGLVDILTLTRMDSEGEPVAAKVVSGLEQGGCRHEVIERLKIHARQGLSNILWAPIEGFCQTAQVQELIFSLIDADRPIRHIKSRHIPSLCAEVILFLERLHERAQRVPFVSDEQATPEHPASAVHGDDIIDALEELKRHLSQETADSEKSLDQFIEMCGMILEAANQQGVICLGQVLSQIKHPYLRRIIEFHLEGMSPEMLRETQKTNEREACEAYQQGHLSLKTFREGLVCHVLSRCLECASDRRVFRAWVEEAIRPSWRLMAHSL